MKSKQKYWLIGILVLVVVGLILGVILINGYINQKNEKQNQNLHDNSTFLQQIKDICEQETSPNKDGCYIRNARAIALIDYNKAKALCNLTSEPRNYDCDLQILSMVDINKVKIKCESTKDIQKKDQCYNILISKISETDPDEAVKLCETKALSKDNCYAMVAEKISFTSSTEVYNTSLMICDKIQWAALKEDCKWSCEQNYKYEREYEK